jgi:apolipoprotein D and lipocalin family protein
VRAWLGAVFALLTLLALPACALQPSGRVAGAAPLTAVGQVDLDRYLGRWYEFARLPNWFERDCHGVTAEYARKPNGEIAVVNTCRKGAPDGPVDRVEGKAQVVDAASNAKLRVAFFWEFWAPYWVLELDPDYRWAIVGEPSGRYFWILTRDAVPSEALRADLLARAARLGYDVTKLEFPRQPPV